MLLVPGLHGAQDMDGGDVGAGESAIVQDLLDAGTGGSDLGCQISQSSRPIADNGGEPGKSTVGDQATFDHATQDIRIDISAAED